jgi:hypothetical protein
MRSSIQCALFFTGLAGLLAACGTSSNSTTSSSSSSSGSAGTGGMASPSSSSSSAASSSSGGTGGSAGTMDAGGDGGPSCEQNCVTNNPSAAALFEGYELKECGCATGSPCATDCTTECMTMTAPAATSPCGMCLLDQANMGVSSTCSVTALETDCANDANCKVFYTCVLMCLI